MPRQIRGELEMKREREREKKGEETRRSSCGEEIFFLVGVAGIKKKKKQMTLPF